MVMDILPPPGVGVIGSGLTLGHPPACVTASRSGWGGCPGDASSPPSRLRQWQTFDRRLKLGPTRQAL